ncbi:MAG: 6-phosphogluconolactonase [Hymenobacteraceae bacterium]|nr:6-phosphogluconolactonase [Hymenobacteraceae bacterium]
MITIAKSPDHLAAAAAMFCASIISEAVNRRGRCSVLLAGGSTPQALYEALSRVPYADNLPWPQVIVAFGDERLVPRDDARSNQQMAQRALLDAVPVKPEFVLAIDTTLPAAEAAAAYEVRLRDYFRLPADAVPDFDLVFLGLGTDGHTASLFPGMAAVQETARLVTTTPAPDPAQPARITVTLPVLNAAHTVVFLVQGADKAGIVRRVLKGGPPAGELLPAQRVRPTGAGAQVKWFIDEAAAAELR